MLSCEMQCHHKTLVLISGLIWFAVGCFLLYLGVHFLMGPVKDPQLFRDAFHPLLTQVKLYVYRTDYAAMLLIAVALLIGHYKGRFVLRKSAMRAVVRIRNLPNPSHIKYLYSGRYWMLLAAMMGLGMSMKFFGVPLDVRGCVDIAVGSALIQGATFYFRNL